MDPITHVLMGAATAQLGFRQRLGRGATWAAVAAAIAPDLDVFAGPVLRAFGIDTGNGNHLAAHRGLSHSFLVAPILALLIAAVWRKWRRRRAQREAVGVQDAGVPRLAAASRAAARKAEARRDETRRGTPSASFALLYACVLAASVTHPLLDWGTAYGTLLLAPLTAARYALSCLPIIDIFFTPILALTVLMCFLARRIARGEARRATLVIGWAGFLLSLGYFAAGLALHERAADRARPLASEERVLRTEAYPALGSIFLWRVVIETDTRWIAARVRPLSAGAAPRTESAPRQASERIEQARRLPEVRAYAWFASDVIRAAETRQDGLPAVEFHDMRYGLWPEDVRSIWPLVVVFDAEGNVRSVVTHLPSPVGNRWRILTATWSDLWEP